MSILIRQETREKLGLKPDDFVLISVGELNENKNHQVIIRAMAELNNPKIHYLLCGQGEKEEELRSLFTGLGLDNNVHLLGFRQDVNEVLLAADLFCFPSKREGLGIAAVEAMAVGLPLVTSNVHGINDYSIDGVSGYSCPSEAAALFAEAIRKMYSDTRKQIIMGNKNRVVASRYDCNRIAPCMKRIYVDMAN